MALHLPSRSRVVVDHVVIVNRGMQAVCPLETGAVGTFTRWRLNRGSRPRCHAAA